MNVLEVLLPTSVSTRVLTLVGKRTSNKSVLTLVGKRTSNKSVERRFESPSPVTPSLRSGGFYILTMLTSRYKVSTLGYNKRLNKLSGPGHQRFRGTFVLHFC
jgi:hypothetical protein